MKRPRLLRWLKRLFLALAVLAALCALAVVLAPWVVSAAWVQRWPRNTPPAWSAAGLSSAVWGSAGAANSCSRAFGSQMTRPSRPSPEPLLVLKHLRLAVDPRELLSGRPVAKLAITGADLHLVRVESGEAAFQAAIHVLGRGTKETGGCRTSRDHGC